MGGFFKKALSSITSKKAKEKGFKSLKVMLNITKRAVLQTIGTVMLPIIIIILILVTIASIVIPSMDEFANNVDASQLLPTDDNYIVKTDEEGAAPAVSKAQLDKGINVWLKSYSGMRKNALEVSSALVSAQDKYKVNAVFMLAIARVECGIGTNSKHGYNWWSFGIQSGYNYNSPDACVNSAANGIANGSYYFTQGKYTVNEIGEVYCPDSDIAGQSQPWQENVRNYMTDLYTAMGITPTSSAGAVQGDIISKAKEIMEYAQSKNMTYSCSSSKSIPGLKNGKYIDCSSYVSWVLYESGYTEFKGPQHSSSTFNSNTMKWKSVKESELKAGDILVYSGHVEIYAGNNQIYNAGSNRALRKKQPLKRTRKFEKALRPPSIVNSSTAGSTSKKGNGYTKTYSKNGKTYKEFKQSRGSYSGVKYSGGTIANSGCGPTSVSIVASGYGSKYNPGTLVSAAKSKYGVSNFAASPESTAKMLKTAKLNYKRYTGISKRQLSSHLKKGKPAVVSVNSSCNAMFTGATHYIAILDIKGDQVYVSNPNPKKKTGWVNISNVITCNSGRAAFLITN